MANKILTTTGYEDRIRGVIGINEAYLPDAIINQPEFLGVGEINITKYVTDYASLTGDDKTMLESATVFEIAQLLCPTLSVRLPKVQQGPHGKHDLADIDWDEKRLGLIGQRDSLLADLVLDTEFFFGMDLTPIATFDQ